MNISLFEHNQTAFDSSVELLDQTGKAAIIHPTGSGKSYIAFKLCEQNPDKTVCWLSPSEYIFETQLENLKADTKGWVPENISFFSYTKLMIMSEDEMQELQPDFIVIDEFHRCGAEMWGQGVERLLNLFPEARILGLSATAIRYLDNQRDMSDELFEGNVASEMTLGEAIVRGILYSPKYILSIYAYQSELFRLESKIKRAKSFAAKAKAKNYLEALKRSLEKADGLDVVFEKHMPDRKGKYIVFCSNRSHLKEMQSKVPEWFGRIDPQPHLYAVYTEGSSAKKTLYEFKSDNSEHLKLLFAIDMLNEGIHVDDISGVILLRPTVSPIVYKQQIGRALSACKKNKPVIFDVVNNIDNLYSVSTIQEEIQNTITYYRYLGLQNKIVNEHFEIIDETRDAKELFEKLNNTLSAPWDIMYGYAKQYFEEHGDLEVVRTYRTPDGFYLGAWIRTQRRVYSGKQKGVLDEERIRKLEAIGMYWRSKTDRSWDKYFAAAQEYYNINGNLRVPIYYISESGVRLGEWIRRIRALRKNNSNSKLLDSERIEFLDSMGMIWDVPDFVWLQNYNECVEYYKQHGNIDVPKGYVTPSGVKLDLWLKNIQSTLRGQNPYYRVTDEQKHQLEELGFQWKSQYDIAWERGFDHAKDYYDTFGNLNVGAFYKSPDGYKLGVWLSTQKTRNQIGKLSQERIDQLNQLEIVWKKPDSWEERFRIAEEYFKEHHDLISMSSAYQKDGIYVGQWLNEQRNIHNGKRKGKMLTEDQVQRLESIGMTWVRKEEYIWQQQFDDVKEYYETYGNLDIPDDYYSKHGKLLLSWIKRQQFAYRHGNLYEERTKKLQSLGLIREYLI